MGLIIEDTEMAGQMNGNALMETIDVVETCQNDRGEYDYIPDYDMDRMSRCKDIESVCGRYRRISKEYESVLVEKAQNGCLRSRDFLVTNNLGFMISEIQKLCPSRDAMQYIDAAVLGMYRAIERFDVSKGTRLISYAVWWIKQHVKTSVREDFLIRFPSNQMDDLGKMLSVVDDEEEINLERAGKKVGLSSSRIEKVHGMLNMRRMDSLDRPLGGGDDGDKDGRTLGELLADDEEEIPYYEVMRDDLNQAVHSVVATLDTRERIAVMTYYGLDNGGGETLEMVGKKFGVTRERARQIILGAMPKLIKRMMQRGITKDVLSLYG